MASKTSRSSMEPRSPQTHPQPTPAASREVDRALRLLRAKIHEQGFTQLRVQEALSWGRTYISQLLRKQKSLRYDQILQILEIVEIEPADFFAELFDLEKPDRSIHPGASGLGNVSVAGLPYDETYPRRPAHLAGSALDPGPEQDLRSTVLALVQLLVKKRLVDPDEMLGSVGLGAVLDDSAP